MRVLFLVNHLSIEGDPMGVMQLSALARAEGWEVKLCVAADDLPPVIDGWQPDLLAVSMMSTDYAFLMPAIRAVRQRAERLPILVGGAHPTFVPSLIHEPALTAICVGEGDGAFREVLGRLAQGNASLDGILNIQTHSGDMPLRPLVETLDDLPFLDREIVYEKSAPQRVFRLRSFYTSRGCPVWLYLLL
jgi:anaerobic magnesium-protoporphyrin IX monomethyl ester cyclase